MRKYDFPTLKHFEEQLNRQSTTFGSAVTVWPSRRSRETNPSARGRMPFSNACPSGGRRTCHFAGRLPPCWALFCCIDRSAVRRTRRERTRKGRGAIGTRSERRFWRRLACLQKVPDEDL